MKQNEIRVGSYVKVTHGELSGKIYKIFDVSNEGNFIAAGVKHATKSVAIDDVIVVSEDDFNDANHDELSQDISFF